MSVVKLCTYTRGFYPTIWGSRTHTMIGMFLVIVDGKIIKRSFSELGYIKGFDTHAEFDVLKAGMKWVIANMDGLRDMNLQVLFCGGGRADCKKIMDEKPVLNDEFFFKNVAEGGRYPVSITPMEKMFNKVEYYSVAKVLINNGENDDPEKAERFNMYDATAKIFYLLYGNSEFNHEIIEDYDDEGIVKKRLVGQPELRWHDGCPKSMDTWT